MNGANSKKAILLLGHGSKASEANETLRKVAASVEAGGGYGFVMPAFLQIERPDFQEAVSMMVAKGFCDITVMPYFLYPGLHVTKDLPGEMETALAKHQGLKLTLVAHLGFDQRLVDITIDRIEEAAQGAPRQAGFAQHPIEAESFRIIATELDTAGIPVNRLPVIKRVIHTTADFGYKDILFFSPNAIEAGAAAIRSGCNIITDVKMSEAGITRDRLTPFGAKVFCFSADRDAASLAERDGLTKTAAGMRKAASYMDGAIIVVGNAPTALTEVLRLVKTGTARPALIIGVPVGFVGAVEAKDELIGSGCEYIATKSRKGGSTVAAAIANALSILALEDAPA